MSQDVTTFLPRRLLAVYSSEKAGFDTIQPYFSIYMEALALRTPMRDGGKFRILAVANNIVKRAEDYIPPEDFLNRAPVQGGYYLITA